jgi:hypothetical protein
MEAKSLCTPSVPDPAKRRFVFVTQQLSNMRWSAIVEHDILGVDLNISPSSLACQVLLGSMHQSSSSRNILPGFYNVYLHVRYFQSHRPHLVRQKRLVSFRFARRLLNDLPVKLNKSASSNPAKPRAQPVGARAASP